MNVQNANTPNCLSLRVSTYNVHFVPEKKRRLWRYDILFDWIRTESTDGNFGTLEKVVISLPFPLSRVSLTLRILVPSFRIFLFLFPLLHLHHSSQSSPVLVRQSVASESAAGFEHSVRFDGDVAEFVEVTQVDENKRHKHCPLQSNDCFLPFLYDTHNVNLSSVIKQISCSPHERGSTSFDRIWLFIFQCKLISSTHSTTKYDCVCGGLCELRI